MSSRTHSHMVWDLYMNPADTHTQAVADLVKGRLERTWVRWLKFLLDVCTLQLSLRLGTIVHNVVHSWSPLGFDSAEYSQLAIGLLFVPLGFWLQQLYPGYGLLPAERLKRRVKSTTVFFLALIAFVFLQKDIEMSRGILVYTFLFAVTLPSLCQFILRSLLIRCGCWGTPVVVVGAARTGEHIVRSLLLNQDAGLRPIAVLDDDREKWGREISGVPVVGGLNRVREFSGKVSHLLLAIPGAGRDLNVRLAQELPFPRVIIVPDLIGLQSLWLESRDLGGVVGLEAHKHLLLPGNWFLKRLRDYLIGVPLFLLSLPVLLFFAVWIVLESPGNPFYYQVREGWGGRKIKVWKLRTMYLDAEKVLQEYLDANPEARKEWEQFFKLKNDPRILKRVGFVLRKTSLDELPQFWNVIIGNMSLVGPRPFPHYHLEKFNSHFRKLRRTVLPGITGLWQVSARSDGDLLVQENLDTYYIRNWSLWLDLSILARTVLIVLTGRGAY